MARILKGFKSKIKNKVKNLDGRAGMTLLIAVLVAEGESTLNEIKQIDRGFESIKERLKKLGANIVRKAE